MAVGCIALLVLCFVWMIQGRVLDNLSVSDIPCSFTIQNLKYDICPLLQSNIRHRKLSIPEETPPTLTTNTYEINLQGALKRDGTLPQDLQCPEGTWICLTVTNTRPKHPSEPIRILQVVPVAGGTSDEELRPKYKLVKSRESPESTLQLTLHGGTYNGKRQKAAFIFSCDRSKERAETVGGMITSPKFSWSFNGTHAFDWKSSYACPEVLQDDDNGNESQPEKGEEDNDSPPPDPDSDSDVEPGQGEDGAGNDQRDKPLRDYSGLLWIPVMLLVLAKIFFIRTYWRIRQGKDSAPSIPVSLRQVCQWFRWHLGFKKTTGYEALKAESDEENEPSDRYDIMREYESFYAVYGQAGAGLGEGEDIPLTPSPRKSTFGYGTGGTSPR
ncbi:hypothetical protein VNI00_012316 [Paramarasmius palmivorus]|uniref:Autophagy-related protein 27 n=1 Tax=Paramarasmius palmivorus TaxID=297713 RepID=A0AAW0CA59_9AGAR